jgi:hypothetical protein
MNDVQTSRKSDKKIQIRQSQPLYSVEFFHIYIDEKISPVHTRSLEYLQAVRDAWNVQNNTIVMIDEYSPKSGSLQPDDVFDFLESNHAKPDYWAYEGDLVLAAEQLLGSLTEKHLEKNYRRYVEMHNKYPCSLLTATWYLTRLGVFDTSVIKECKAESTYQAADRLINILPAAYKPVEKRAHELIAKSKFGAYQDMIQDLFYEADYDREVAIF